MLTSPNSLKFWLGLCGARQLPGSAALIQEFERHAQQGKPALAAFCERWTIDLLAKVRLDDVALWLAELSESSACCKPPRYATRVFWSWVRVREDTCEREREKNTATQKQRNM